MPDAALLPGNENRTAPARKLLCLTVSIGPALRTGSAVIAVRHTGANIELVIFAYHFAMVKIVNVYTL